MESCDKSRQQKSKGTHWVSLFIDRYTAAVCFWLFWNRKEVLIKIKDSSIANNVYRTQKNDYVMCGFHCIAFIEYMLSGKALSDFIYLLTPDGYKTNDKMIL